MLAYISIIVTAIFVNNIVFAQFLGICPFMGVSKKLSSAVGMGGCGVCDGVCHMCHLVASEVSARSVRVRVYADDSVYTCYSVVGADA